MDKELREVSIEGCREIGRGAHGIVYQTAPDMLVKVYREEVPMESIRREQALARWAFVKGLPTAIPFDVVRVGNCRGMVYELLDAVPAQEYIHRSPEHLERFIRESVKLMKQVHGTLAEPGKLPDMKQQTLSWAESLRDKLPPAQYAKLMRIIHGIPDRLTLLHADFHLKNILICHDELMLIDMDTLCTGDPVFELATVYNSYREFPSIDPEAAAFLGIDVKTAERICDRTFELYLGENDAGQAEAAVRKARLLGCVRIIDYMDRHRELPPREKCIRHCLRDIGILLEEDFPA